MVPVARAFGMDVIAWSRNLDPARAADAGAEPVAKDELFRRADVVSVHYKLSDRSRGIVGSADIAAMRPPRTWSTRRAGRWWTRPRCSTPCTRGAIAGAALDVFDREPLAPDDPLRAAPRTVLSPHLGYVTRENYRVFFTDVVEDIAAWLDGRIERRITPDA